MRVIQIPKFEAKDFGKLIKKHKPNHLGYVDTDGRVFVTGRMKRMIVRFDGYKIYPSAIENEIAKHSAVNLCAVIGTDHEGLGRMPKAYVVLKEEYFGEEQNVEEEIRNMCLSNLAERAVPESFEFVSEIPLTAIGKIDFKKLEEMDADNLWN